jgi:hypothetical protein
MQVNPCHHYLILRVMPSLIFYYYFVLYLLKSLVSFVSQVPHYLLLSLSKLCHNLSFLSITATTTFPFFMVMVSGYSEVDSVT